MHQNTQLIPINASLTFIALNSLECGMTNTNFLFLLHLRDPFVQQMHSLNTLDLVSHFYHYDKQASLVTSCVTQDGGKSVTILLDGYDELPVNLQQNSFIGDLLERKVLLACS